MKTLVASAVAFAALAAPDTERGGAMPSRLVITHPTSQAISKTLPDSFTGEVDMIPLFATTEHTRASGGQVSFQPCARTAWHTHPAGQTLIVTSGTGWVQEWGGHKREIKAGDVIWTPPGVKHWHGGTSKSAMTHIAIQETVNGKNVDWLEKVTDEQYGEA